MPQKNRTAKGVLGGLLGLIGLSAVAGVLVTATVTPALAVAGAAGSQALDLFENLPSYLKPDAPMEPSTFYGTDKNGKTFAMATFFDQNRTQVEFDQISPVMYDAILSSEDKGFYEHGGVNLGATAKALIDNVQGTSSRGASTISQQYVKNVLVQQCEQKVLPGDENYADKTAQCWLDATNAVGTDGIERKLQEMRYAIQIEKDYSKNEILLGYLNIASFGGTVYGIEAASKYYFSTTSANLTVAQAATLAGIVQNPNRYRIDKVAGSATDTDGNPVNSEADGWALTKDRRDYVIQRMYDDGKITEAQYNEALESPITPAIKYPTQGCAAAGNNAYFCQYVKTVVLSDPAFGDTPQERQQSLQRKGLDIYTSLDMRIQEPAIIALRDRVPATYDEDRLGAAGVTVEPSTGRILAMTQNTNFRETETDDPAYTGLVYASDKSHGGSIGVHVGSTYKLFTLIDWLEKGHSVNEVINGRNQTLEFNASCDNSTSTLDTKDVGNFGNSGGYYGTPMKFTRDSLNSGFFSMAAKLDLCDINGVADRMGVTTYDVDAQKQVKTTYQNVPYDVLGSKNIAPLAMAGAYATVANKGIYCTPRAIDKIVDQSGAELPIPDSSCSQVIEPEIAATAAYALQGVMANGGTGSQANPWDGTPLIGKTGSHQLWSTMMIESSTKATTAVWVGRPDSTTSIWNRYFNGTALQNLRYGIARDMQSAANQALGGGEQFPAADSNLTRRVLTDLPSVVGMSIDEATSTLQNAGFSVTVGPAVDSDLAKDLVAAQDPAAGKVAGGTTVTISPSNGDGATVPDVSGSSPDEAEAALNAAGFSKVSQHKSCSAPDAEVSGTSPAANSATKKSAKITITCT
ncbi:transglycosylase domain-containing protein [Microbacterium sp. TWP3-1-2b2]|uniref:transglycosylase domain-containing protein n=1 Tax=Microbacterium sp. TWP3-1-2b2 TaxID=2804651 RepID=UPI003CEC2D20